jgi:hypothetical protein
MRAGKLGRAENRKAKIENGKEGFNAESAENAEFAEKKAATCGRD